VRANQYPTVPKLYDNKRQHTLPS